MRGAPVIEGDLRPGREARPVGERGAEVGGEAVPDDLRRQRRGTSRGGGRRPGRGVRV